MYCMMLFVWWFTYFRFLCALRFMQYRVLLCIANSYIACYCFGLQMIHVQHITVLLRRFMYYKYLLGIFALRFMFYILLFCFAAACTADSCTTCGTATKCDECIDGFSKVDTNFDNDTDSCECKTWAHCLSIVKLFINMICANTIYKHIFVSFIRQTWVSCYCMVILVRHFIHWQLLWSPCFIFIN